MDRKNTSVPVPTLLAQAFPAQTSLFVTVGAVPMPLVWVDGRGTSDAMQLQARLTAMAQLSEDELTRAYGQVDANWIYAYGRASAFFLRVVIDAPSFPAPAIVPALRTEFAVRFLLEERTVRVLRMIARCQSVLLHFEMEPEWEQRLSSLQGHEGLVDLGERGGVLVRSSLLLLFRPDLIARMASQLDEWERVFRQRKG